jgi:hypothetical protein
LKNEIWKIPNANIRILDVVRLVHGYFIFVTFESQMLEDTKEKKIRGPNINKINVFGGINVCTSTA